MAVWRTERRSHAESEPKSPCAVSSLLQQQQLCAHTAWILAHNLDTAAPCALCTTPVAERGLVVFSHLH